MVSETSLWELARVVASAFDRARSSVPSAHAVGGSSSDEHFVVVDGLLLQEAEASSYIFS